MPTLMGLPNEILIFIIEATDPEDIESFSTCCKLMHSLAKHRLEEHKEKKRLFSKIFVEDYFLWAEGLGKLSTIIGEFISDERIHLYPKAMAVRLVTDGNGIIDEYDDDPMARMSAINGLDEVEQQLECRMTEIHSTIGLEVGGIDSKMWGKHVKAGYPTATFLLLLALLPNLEMLSVDILGYSHPMNSPNYARIMRLMTENALEQKKNGLSFGGRLSKCKINGNFFETIEETLLPLLMVLPSMRKLRGCFITMENYSWPYADAVSPVVDLDLHGAIDGVTLSNYIRGIRELKRFQFTHACFENIGWEPCGIVATLRQFAFRSLVYLNLTTDMEFEIIWLESSPYIGSLSLFEVLEIVRLHYILLFEEVRTVDSYGSADVVNSTQTLEDLLDKSLVQGQNLIDFLPSSIRTFELKDISKGGLILDTFEGFLEHRVERLPNLQLIELDAGDETNSQIEKICKKAGVLWMKSGEQ